MKLYLSSLALGLSASAAFAQSSTIETTLVSAKRNADADYRNSVSISKLSDRELALIGASHAEEITRMSAGAWVSRGDGQEHLTAIRSPVFTGAGACAAFLIAEDSIPVRAPGFCNINQMFDTHYEVAQSVEVFRGPSSAVFGSNALFGGINVLSPALGGENFIAMEVGAEDFYRFNAKLGNSSHQISTTLTDAGSFRIDSGYRQQKIAYKANVIDDQDWLLSSRLSVNNLEQETAGFIFGEYAYRNPELRGGNENPEAYRDVKSIRGDLKLRRELSRSNIEIQPYFRYHEMQFLMHFLPWQPTEFNEHQSLGVRSAWFHDSDDQFSFSAGLDLDFTQAELKEEQFSSAPFAQQNFPEGEHYRYKVQSNNLSPFAELIHASDSGLTLGAQLRWEQQEYDYENLLEDGSACESSASACRFFRPASRSDQFSALVWRLEANYLHSQTIELFANIGTAFRAPQATELYRLQNPIEESSLQEVETKGYEFGVKGQQDKFAYHIAHYQMTQENGIYQDNARQYLIGAETSHTGLEAELSWQVTEQFRLRANASIAKHLYENSPQTLGVSVDIEGNEIDTAPRRMGSVQADWQYSESAGLFLSYSTMGEYYLDPANQHHYDGHQLLNVSWQQSWSSWQLSVRVKNIADTKYAERADIAFGNYRYFPGAGRSAYIQLKKIL
jgi:iron complex outermembrane receptor protein